jgi:hypothetical protein
MLNNIGPRTQNCFCQQESRKSLKALKNHSTIEAQKAVMFGGRSFRQLAILSACHFVDLH